jgi:hypothetical protein
MEREGNGDVAVEVDDEVWPIVTEFENGALATAGLDFQECFLDVADAGMRVTSGRGKDDLAFVGRKHTREDAVHATDEPTQNVTGDALILAERAAQFFEKLAGEPKDCEVPEAQSVRLLRWCREEETLTLAAPSLTGIALCAGSRCGRRRQDHEHRPGISG